MFAVKKIHTFKKLLKVLNHQNHHTNTPAVTQKKVPCPIYPINIYKEEKNNEIVIEPKLRTLPPSKSTHQPKKNDPREPR